jgi:hypothetical protein
MRAWRLKVMDVCLTEFWKGKVKEDCETVLSFFTEWENIEEKNQ